MLEHDLHWNDVLDDELRNEEVVGAARALDLRLADLRACLTIEGAAEAVHRELEALGAAGEGAADQRDARLAEASAALARWVRGQLHLAIERQTEHAYALNFAVDTTSGITNRAYALRTEVIARMRKACASMDGGSIAIVGPHGIGKSRLVGHFCGAEAHQDRLAISTVVPACPGYDALEFVKRVLARLCQEVVDKVATDDVTGDGGQIPPGHRVDRVKTRWIRLGAVLAWGGASLIVVGALNVRTDPLLIIGATCLVVAAAISRTPSSVSASDAAWRVSVARMLRKCGEQLPFIGVGITLIAASQFGTNVDPLIVVGTISLAIASTMRGPPTILRNLTSAARRPLQLPPAVSPHLVKEARKVLEQLEHIKTDGTSEDRTRDGRFGRRFSLTFGKSSKISEKRTPIPWTLPVALAKLEWFILKDAKDLGVWIGIDLQRMGPDRSRPFLEEIESVLTLERKGCFVLVCVRGAVPRAVRRRAQDPRRARDDLGREQARRPRWPDVGDGASTRDATSAKPCG